MIIIPCHKVTEFEKWKSLSSDLLAKWHHSCYEFLVWCIEHDNEQKNYLLRQIIKSLPNTYTQPSIIHFHFAVSSTIQIVLSSGHQMFYLRCAFDSLHLWQLQKITFYITTYKQFGEYRPLQMSYDIIMLTQSSHWNGTVFQWL